MPVVPTIINTKDEERTSLANIHISHPALFLLRFPATFILIVYTISLLYIHPSYSLPLVRLGHRLYHHPKLSTRRYTTSPISFLFVFFYNLHYIHPYRIAR